MNDYEVIERHPGDTLNGTLASGGTVQQVRSTYATAIRVQIARKLADVQRRVLEEARLAGEEFYYGWGAGKDTIEGPSIKLALALARCWGNCAVECLPVQDLSDCWIFTAAFVDLETGFTLTRQFRQSKNWTVHGKLDSERKEDIRFQIGQSKAVRNVLLNALPSSLVTRALSAAKEGVRSELEDLIKRHSFAAVADRLITALGKCGIKEGLILAKCQVAEKKALTVENLITLRGDLSAIQNGQERAEVLFPVVEGEILPGDDKSAEAKSAEGAPPKKPKPPSKQLQFLLVSIDEAVKRCNLTEEERADLLHQYNLKALYEADMETAKKILENLGEIEGNLRRDEELGDEPDAAPE